MNFQNPYFWPQYAPCILPAQPQTSLLPMNPFWLPLYNSLGFERTQNELQAESIFEGYIPSSSYLQEIASPEGNKEKETQKTEPVARQERRSRDKTRPQRDRRILRQCLEPAKYDRNIQSNALKLFLKHLRSISKSSAGLVKKIILNLELQYSAEQFIQDLNVQISPSLNYIRPCQIKDLCDLPNNNKFSTVFRISLKHFFTREIHMISTRPIRTNRFVRREQVKAGRKVLCMIFDS